MDDRQLIALLMTFKNEIIQTVDERFDRFRGEMVEEFRHQMGVQREDFQHKLDLVVEGHEVLRHEMQEFSHKTDERFNLVDFKIDILNKKIDAVAADLKDHRSDTESHQGVWRVKEE